jgi:glutamine amidotransferase
MIAIINYGSGNVRAIANIYTRQRVPFVMATEPAMLADADRFLLPGVGSFDQCMRALNASGMREALDRYVLEEKRPVLGICVGMQMLARSSEEGSELGLGWIDGDVRKFEPGGEAGRQVRLPHMGWNTVLPVGDADIFRGVDLTMGYYFLHSYYFACATEADVLATTEYAGRFASAVRRDHIRGVQFHPEKSHQAGIVLLENFSRG